ncbi:hypothetical protein [Mycobacterium avium]|uniref:hypothetical protein n=1 Tax=Mycobacterium avium TaxID=1764 RepID=UPI001E317047|nr:hypothetical protein [Mycobacterium avium]
MGKHGAGGVQTRGRVVAAFNAPAARSTANAATRTDRRLQGAGFGANPVLR